MSTSIRAQGYIAMLDDVIFPVTPSKITIKVKGKNKTYTLATCEEINALNAPGLTEYEFDVMLPAHSGYSFARYLDGFLSPAWFLAYFADAMAKKKAVRLRFIRSGSISRLPIRSKRSAMTIPYNQDARVSLESYTIKEDSGNGTDLIVSLKFKQFVDYGTKVVRVLDDGKTYSVVSASSARETDNAPTASTYTVKKGDTVLTLWKLAKKYTGDASNYFDIMTANGITSAILEEGQVLKLPW